eukprot:3969590-Pleurochrysis_carterae.AAC.1
MAIVVITSSQPSAYARISRAYNALGRGLTREAEVRRQLPHGLAMCSVLFVLIALITRGDAAFNDHYFAHARTCAAFDYARAQGRTQGRAQRRAQG